MLELEYETPNFKLAATLLQSNLKMAMHVRLNRRARQLQGRRRPRWFRDPQNPLENLAEDEVFERYRFRPATILYLVQQLGIQAATTARNCPMPPLLQLLAFLRFVATGTIHLNVGNCVGYSRTTAGRAIRAIAVKIAHLARRYIRFPTGQRAMVAKDEFAAIAGALIIFYLSNFKLKFITTKHQ